MMERYGQKHNDGRAERFPVENDDSQAIVQRHRFLGIAIHTPHRQEINRSVDILFFMIHWVG